MARLIPMIFGLALISFACGRASGPPTVGEAKDFSNVCDKANDGKRVSLDGYLRFPESFTGNQSVVLRLYKTADLTGSPIGVQTKIGPQANHIDPVPKQFTDKDLKVHLANGETSSFGSKVRVSGSVYFPIVTQEFVCALENPLIESAR